jgi:hypothetical protein
MASSYYYKRLNTFLAYPSIIVSTVASIGAFGFGQVSKYVASSLSLLAAVLVALGQYTQSAQRAQDFVMRAKDFYAIIREIDFILSLPMTERENAPLTMSRVKVQFDRAVDMSLDPPIHIIRMYEKTYHSLDPIIFENVIMTSSPPPSAIHSPIRRSLSRSNMTNNPRGRASFDDVMSVYQLFNNSTPFDYSGISSNKNKTVIPFRHTIPCSFELERRMSANGELPFVRTEVTLDLNQEKNDECFIAEDAKDGCS